MDADVVVRWGFSSETWCRILHAERVQELTASPLKSRNGDLMTTGSWSQDRVDQHRGVPVSTLEGDQ